MNDTTPKPIITPGQVLTAFAILLLCCVAWGASFPLMQQALDPIREVILAAIKSHTGKTEYPEMLVDISVAAGLNGWRFMTAAFIYALLTWKTQLNITRKELLGGMLIGALFTGGMLGQVAGLRYTSPTISSLLTSMTVVFTPLAQALLLRSKPGLLAWIAAMLALAGVAVLSWPGSDNGSKLAVLPPFLLAGEILTALGAVFFTAQLLVLDRLGNKVDGRRITCAMFFSTAIFNLTVASFASQGALVSLNVPLKLVSNPDFLWRLVVLVVFCSLLAIHLMNLYQRYLKPSQASVAYSSESLFAALWSLMLGTEQPRLIVLWGGLLITSAVILVSIGSQSPTKDEDPDPGLEKLPA